ncbi:hypothetical protein F2Q68_00025761 [Brassica cretica]|uniref:SWIM-type domain-containing protein n=1 Tax=Brassica cretica TaxID=69181 RepID=A0A8S9ICR7_BRACR|nr:hypothetical protein F2Q68_00025761 [Brassica cretica]
MTVQPIDGWRFFTKGGKMDCVIDLEHGKCDCGVYVVEKISCSHDIAAGTSAGLHISTLVRPVYSKDFLFAGYSENIYLCVGQQVEERTCLPPDVKRGPGRQKKSRWQSLLELSRMRGRKPRKQHRVYRCSKCKETAHTKPQLSRPVISLPEDLQLGRPEGRPVSRPGFFFPEDLQVIRPMISLPEVLRLSRPEGRPEGRPVSRSGFSLPEDLQVSRPVFSLPEDLQLSHPGGRPVSRPGFFLPEDLQVSRPVFSLPEDLQLSRPKDLQLSRPEDLQLSRPVSRPMFSLCTKNLCYELICVNFFVKLHYQTKLRWFCPLYYPKYSYKRSLLRRLSRLLILRKI